MALHINGEYIDPSRIENEIQRLRPSHENTFQTLPEEDREKQLAEWSRENVIESVVFHQQARKEFPSLADELIESNLTRMLAEDGENGPLHQRISSDPNETDRLRQHIGDQIRQELLLQKLAGTLPAPTDKAVRRYYEQHLDRYTIPETIHAAHIVKHPCPDMTAEDARNEMDAIYQELCGGASFEELASKHSDCPDQGGDLGSFSRGKMVQGFEDIVFAMEPGTFSKPFETEFGLHIAKVYEKRPSIPCDLDQVREVIIQDLLNQAKQKALEDYLDTLKAEAVIEER